MVRLARPITDAIQFKNGAIITSGTGPPTSGASGVAGVTFPSAADGSIYLDIGTGMAIWVKQGTGKSASYWVSSAAALAA